MATPNHASLSGLICFSFLLVMSPYASGAGLLENTCDLVYERLASGPHEILTNSFENFTDDGMTYHGCVIHLSGNVQNVTASQNPEGLFGQPLPYCQDGKLPASTPRNFLNADGWCGDRNADGPDGTSYRTLKKNVFCLIEGRWDGGDDSDPKYVPSPRYEVTVRCANK